MEVEEIKTTKLEDIKCPVCGGVVNRWQFAGWYLDNVILVCECWSGDLDKESNYHLFKVFAPIAELNLNNKEILSK